MPDTPGEQSRIRRHPVRRWRFRTAWVCAGSIWGLLGCSTLQNSWFDPSAVGSFTQETTLDIRTSLSIQDTPAGVAGATDPTPEDLEPVYEEYKFAPGDVLNVRVFELLASGTETAVQATVDEIGTISLPVLGQFRVAGMTRGQIEQEMVKQLDVRGVLHDAQVVVEPLVRRNLVYTVYGAISQPNVYPLSRPNTHLLEALNVAGGLVETVTDIFVVREQKEQPTAQQVGYLTGRQAGSARLVRRDRRPSSESHEAAVASAFSVGGSDPQQVPDRSGSTNPDKSESAKPEAELIEAVEPPRASAGTDQPSGSTTSRSGPARWVFVNGEWVQTTGESTPVPQSAEPAVPVEPGPAVPEVDWDRLADHTENRVIRISATGLRGGDRRQNIVIRSGDTIRLLAGQTGEYYIMGQINRPGAYSITGRRITLKTAIASAGNLAPLAWPDRCTIYRRYGDREEMHQVNLDAIFAGKESDILLKNEDLILVGTHPAASFLAVFRNAFRLTYGFGFVYDRNFGDIDSFGGQTNPSVLRRAGVGQRFPNLFR